MKKKPERKYINRVFFAATLMLLSVACSPRAASLYNQAYSEIDKGHYRIAADLLEKSSNLENDNVTKYKYLTEAARLVRFEMQEYERAIRMCRNIILNAEDLGQRIAAQEAITEMYLENIQDYTQALRELQILEPLLTETKKKEKIKLRIAQTLYLTGNNQQALEEINAAQKYIKFHEVHFMKLKAEVLLAQKKYKESIAAYEELKAKSLAFFREENLFIAASIVYEENQEYNEALNYLTKNEELIKDKAYYELRVKRLKERMMNKPLFKGRRK